MYIQNTQKMNIITVVKHSKKTRKLYLYLHLMVNKQTIRPLESSIQKSEDKEGILFAVLILWLKRVAYQGASDQLYITASGMLRALDA